MVVPGFQARIKQRYAVACLRIYSSQIGTLVEVESLARQRKIVHAVQPAMLSGNNMLEVVA